LRELAFLFAISLLSFVGAKDDICLNRDILIIRKRTVIVDEFSKRVGEIDQEKLKHYLGTLQSPCYESQLLRIAFPEMEISSSEPLTLYQNHFLLFHVLYRLQDEFYQEEKYLFIHFMRTMVVPYPEDSFCRFYEELLGRFCQAACPAGHQYCEFHANQLGDTALNELSLRYFYLDQENFYKLDEETATAFINGTWEILTHYGKYQKSFKILGLPETADLRMIKKRFRQLAKEYHPDRGAQSNHKFHEINNAYQLLMHIHSMMSTFRQSDNA
jgi:hypothetical protein